MSPVIENYIKEIDDETMATRKCLERIPMELAEYKPHEKSMKMGYLAQLVAEIPKWIQAIVEDNEVNFTTFKHDEPKTTEELVACLNKNIEGAKKALQNATEADLEKTFSLKNGEQVLYSSPVNNNISSSINHWVHHRGQLTVYMRLNNIEVPSIYGPSADEKSFTAP